MWTARSITLHFDYQTHSGAPRASLMKADAWSSSVYIFVKLSISLHLDTFL